MLSGSGLFLAWVDHVGRAGLLPYCPIAAIARLAEIAYR